MSNMIDREKTISRLQIIRTWADVGKKYDGIQGEKCLQDVVDWLDDAINLLKEQKSVKPDLDSELNFTCANCGETVGYKSIISGCIRLCNYCPHCGKAVKWDD